VFHLIDVGHIFCHGGFSKHVETPEDALIWEVQVAVAVATVLLGGFLQWALLGDVPLFVAIVAEVITASTLKKGMLNWASMSWG